MTLESALLTIFILTFVSNLSLIAGMTVNVDSWILVRWLNSNQIDKLHEFYKKIGTPQYGWLVSHLWSISKSNLLVSGIFVFVMRFVHSYSIFIILNHHFSFKIEFALAVTLVTVLYPAQNFLFDHIIGVQYGFLWPLYLFGINLLLFVKEISDYKSHLLAISSILILIYSFAMKSILFLTPILSCFFLLFFADNKTTNPLFNLYLFLLLILPFIYWLLNEKYFPRSDNYFNYNNFLGFQEVPKFLKITFSGVAVSQFGGLLNVVKIFRFPQFWLILSISLIPIITYDYTDDLIISSQLSQRIFFASIILSLVCVIPYTLVGQIFDSSNTQTKNNIMQDLPFGLFVFSIYNLLFETLNHFFIVLLITLLLYRFWENFNLWILYSKQSALQLCLNALPKKSDIAFFVLDLTSYKSSNLKSHLYPMTLFYMANSLERYSNLKCGMEGNFTKRSDVINAVREKYSSSPLPFVKSTFKPSLVFKVTLVDDSVTVRNLLIFIKHQFKKDPLHLTTNNLFKCTVEAF